MQNDSETTRQRQKTRDEIPPIKKQHLKVNNKVAAIATQQPNQRHMSNTLAKQNIAKVTWSKEGLKFKQSTNTSHETIPPR